MEMKVSPIRTLPLRVRLNGEGRYNALLHRISPWLEKLWAQPKSNPPQITHSRSYLQLEIHPYALIGHQVASWVHGYLWAQDLGLKYLGGQLSRDPGGLLNFKGLVGKMPSGDFKIVRLVWVDDERNPRSLRLLQAQVARAQRKYSNRALVFRLALDPARWDQVPAEGIVRSAMLSGYKGVELTDLEASSDYVAIHIRRGSDIHQNHISGKEGINRWVLEEWHLDIIKALRSIPSIASMEIRVYALGQVEDFPLLAQTGVVFKLNGDRDTDITELTAAKLLVLSPSSFSFTAALASRSAVLGRFPWWHNIPNEGRWLTVDAEGQFDVARLESLVSLRR